MKYRVYELVKLSATNELRQIRAELACLTTLESVARFAVDELVTKGKGLVYLFGEEVRDVRLPETGTVITGGSK